MAQTQLGNVCARCRGKHTLGPMLLCALELEVGVLRLGVSWQGVSSYHSPVV